MLIYLSASNFEKYRSVAIMNQSEKREGDLQLDPVTGSLFRMNDKGELISNGNVGMHQRKAA